MDPFDEFEFKPLTEGLGFHKKAVSLKDGLKKGGVVDDELQAIPGHLPKNLLDETGKATNKKHTFEDVLSALEKTPLQRKESGLGLEFTETLPREGKKEALDTEKSRPSNSPFPRQEAYKGPVPGTAAGAAATTATSTKPSVGTRRGGHDSPQRNLIPATLSLPSALLDLVIVVALALVFLVALLTVTKVDLNVVMRNLNQDIMTQISLAAVFVAVMQMYVVISRSYFGRTLGEWTFDLQIGEEAQQKSEIYPLRVVLRSLVVTLTGLVLLPLISALIGRDISGSISGVQLYRQRI